VSLIKIILYIAVIIMALSVLNVPMSSIITILGAAGLAISLALQSCLSNLSGGFIILFTKPFTTGDIIELDDSVGTVRDIGIFYTKIVTFDNKTVFIPNGKVTDAKIVNYTETPTRRIDLTFDISYSTDFGKARDVILEIISNEKLILKTPEPIVRMSAHNSSSISIDVLVWVNNADYLTERYNMTEAVKAAFDENGIVIPFPQLDIHVKDKI
jgi:small conductance mechanosensitive channel